MALTLEDRRNDAMEMARITLTQFRLGHKEPTVATMEFAARMLDNAIESQKKIDKRNARKRRAIATDTKEIQS